MRAPRERRPTFSQAELQEKNVYEVGRLRSALQMAQMEHDSLSTYAAGLERRNTRLLATVREQAEKIEALWRRFGEMGAPIDVPSPEETWIREEIRSLAECSICRGNHGPEIQHACE